MIQLTETVLPIRRTWHGVHDGYKFDAVEQGVGRVIYNITTPDGAIVTLSDITDDVAKMLTGPAVDGLRQFTFAVREALS